MQDTANIAEWTEIRVVGGNISAEMKFIDVLFFLSTRVLFVLFFPR